MIRVYNVIEAEGETVENNKKVFSVKRERILIPLDADPITEALRQVEGLRKCTVVRVRLVGQTEVRNIREYKMHTAEELREPQMYQQIREKGYKKPEIVREYDFGGVAVQISKGNIERWGDVPRFGPAEVW